MKQTKIVASISDLHCDQEFIRSLYDAGMNVVRMNTAHANREGLENDVLTLDDPRRAIQLPQDVISAGLEANPRRK